MSNAAPAQEAFARGVGGRQRNLKGRVAIGVALVVIVVGMLSGCSRQDGSSSGDVTSTMTSVTSATSSPSGRAGIVGDFGEAVMVVTRADGTVDEWCLLAARTDAARQQGLMDVTDAGLGGYDGMVFRFDKDVSGGFWMRHTRLPLSIAYVDAAGGVVKITDMAPCPDSDATCPNYGAGGSYRDAVEVPEGELDRLGVTAESTLAFRDEACPPAT